MVEELAGGVARGDPPGNEAEELNVTRPNPFSATITWRINWNQAKAKQKCLQSKYVEVGGKDCRLLVYPSGDTQALPGYVSFYLQLQDPNLISNHRWDCFASYTLAVLNSADRGADLSRESWHRFSSRPARQQTRPLSSSSHGWADFTSAAQILDAKAGFLVNGCITVSATVLVLEESVQFTRDTEGSAAGEESLSGKFTWRMSNFGLFRDMIRVQKIMSPPFSAGDCSLRISVYQSTVGGKEHLSLCLESKDLEATAAENEKTCWCLFRLGITNSKEGCKPFTRESFGRFSTDLKQTDSASLGWNDFMSMDTFTDAAQGYLKDGAAVFQASFQALKESSTVHRACPFRELTFNGRQAPRRIAGPQAKAGSKAPGAGAADSHQATFVWRIEHFSRLKDVLKKRKITGLCVKSRRFLVGGYTCRLIIYPRGQSQPPQHLSMFLEVSDGQSSGNWSCFVSHRLAIVNQRDTSRSLVKESQNRYMKSAKDWGWREFITLQALFDADAGYLVNDDCIFAAEVLMLKESSEAHQMLASELASIEPSRQLTVPPAGGADKAAAAKTGEEVRFTWRLENFAAFRSILETRKVFSRFFAAEGCKLRVGAYTSLNTLCTYLESDVAADGQAERNFWVKSRVAVLNQRHPERTIWKESAICTKTWNSSVLQLIDLNELMDPESGFLGREGLILRVDVLECCPWFEFADLETYTSDQEAGVDASTDAYSESISTGTSSEEGSQVDDEEGSYFWQMMTFGYTVEWEDMTIDDARSATELIADDLATYYDESLVKVFMEGFQEFLDSPARVKLLLQPLKGQDPSSGKQLCLLDFLSTPKQIRQHVVQTLLSKLAEISDPESSAAVQPSAAHAEALAPPVAEPSPRETFTEGSTQPSPQRTGRVERRYQQLRAKQRTRPEVPAAEATRARSTSCAASSAFIPEGQSHLVKDERRQISEDAACSTAFVGEESPLRPAGARSAGARAAGSALAEHSSAATERSADLDAEDSSSASIEDITGTTANVQSPSSKQLRMLARKLSQAEPGLKLSSSTLKQASDLISQATAKIEAQMSSGAMDSSVLSGLSQDTDFTALLQDIASGPASLSELSCKPDEAQESSRPSSEGEKDNMADSASEDVAAASVSAERKSFRQRFNPMRGFLSRRTSSVTSSQEPQCSTAASSLDTSQPITAEAAQQAEDAESAYSTEEGASQSEVHPATTSMQPQPQHAESSQQHLQTMSGKGNGMQAATKQSQDVLEGPTAQDGSAEALAQAQQGHEDDALQHQQSAHSVSSEEVLGMGLQWLQSAYKGWTAEIETCELPVLPAEPEGLEPVRSLLAGLPAQEQAALALMAPSMVHKSSQGELGLLLLETLMEEQHKSRKLNQHARMAVLAALTQIEITDTDACSRIVTRLSAVLQYSSFSTHELPWAVAAILHCMAALPAEPSARPGPATRAAGAVLRSACLLWGFPASATCEAVRAAAQRHQITAGHLLGSCTAAPGSTEDSHGHPGNAAVRQALHALVLMECIQQPQLRSEAASTLMQSIAQGRLGDKEVSGAIEECASSPAGRPVLMPDAHLGSSAPSGSAEAPEHASAPAEEKRYQQLWSGLVSCKAHTDPQHILWLGDRMLASPEKAVSQCASSLFTAVARHFPSKETEGRVVASLVDKAMAGGPAPASASSVQQGKAQRSKKGGASAPLDGSQAAPAGSANVADAAKRALLALMREAEGCGQLALTMIMQKASAPAKEVDRLSQQLQKLERDLEAARNAEVSARAEAASEAKRRALQSAEAEAAGANARSEHAQALNTLQASVKKLEGRCEQLEKQVEWVKSERDEAQKVAEASAARVKELETAASRQKGHRKDDSKKAAKESKAALHKAEVAEAARRKADEELKRVRAEASGAAELAATQVAASKALASSAESALAAKNAEAGQLAGKVRELEVKLAAAQQQSGQLSAAVEQEQRKIRFYFGHDLEQLGWEALQELEQFHQRGLAHLLPRLAEKRQQALDETASQQAAAVTAAVAESVVGSPRASGRASGSATPSLPHTPTASTGGITPRDLKISPQLGLHQGSMGSVESGASLDSRPVPKRASSASSTASNWPAHAGGTLHHGKGPLATHAHMNGAGGMHPMAPPNRAPSPVPSDPLVKLTSRPAGNGSNAPGGRLGPLSSPFKIAHGSSPPSNLASAAASVMGPPGKRTPPPPQQFGSRSSLNASRAPGGSLTGGRPQRDVRVRLDATNSSSVANLQAAFSASAAPDQAPQRSGSEGVTFPCMSAAAPDQERRGPAQPPGSSGLFGAGHSAFSTTLWPHQMQPQAQNGISGTHRMWG